MQADDYWFAGIVRKINSGCAVDARCTVTIEVSEHLGGRPLERGEAITIIESYGFSPHRCYGSWGQETIGSEVTVLSHKDEDGNFAICADERYFVRVDGTVTSIDTPPYPTCPPEIDCDFLRRTVTIELWSCNGGPCDGEDSGCQRGVSLQIGDQFWNPDPFFCLVQFHNAPVGDYLVSVARRVACGPACDAAEQCSAVASADRIAIVPVADGECPVHVVRAGATP